MHIRKECIVLAKNNNTPIPFWLDMPLFELRKWIEANNSLIEEKENEGG